MRWVIYSDSNNDGVMGGDDAYYEAVGLEKVGKNAPKPLPALQKLHSCCRNLLYVL